MLFGIVSPFEVDKSNLVVLSLLDTRPGSPPELVLGRESNPEFFRKDFYSQPLHSMITQGLFRFPLTRMSDPFGLKEDPPFDSSICQTSVPSDGILWLCYTS